MTDDFIPVDGKTTTDQGVWLKFLSKGTKHQPHEPTAFGQRSDPYEAGLLASDPERKFCPACGEWKPKVRFSPACEDEVTPDGLHWCCYDDQRRYEPKTLGLRRCPKCAQQPGNDGLVAETAFSPGATYCKLHESEKQRVRRRNVP